MYARLLFRFSFNAQLTPDRIELIERTTGMAIRDVENAGWQDPGLGEFAGTIDIALGSRNAPNAWLIEATTWDENADLEAALQMREKVLSLLAQFAEEVQELPSELNAGMS
jgi:hypothetical protein